MCVFGGWTTSMISRRCLLRKLYVSFTKLYNNLASALASFPAIIDYLLFTNITKYVCQLGSKQNNSVFFNFGSGSTQVDV